MKTNFYKITLILLVLFISNVAAFSQISLLLVSVDNNVADSLLMEYLEARDYDITYVSTTQFQNVEWANANTYADYDAMFIAEQVNSGHLTNFHLAGYPIPCVNTEAFCYRTSTTKWNWLSDEASQFKQFGSSDGATAAETNTIVFLGDETTWLGRQYEADHEMIWTSKVAPSDGSSGIAFQYDIIDAIPLAIIRHDSLGEDKPVMWAFPEGTSVTTEPNGTTPVDVTLPARMVYLGMVDAGQDSATVEFLELVDKCLKWVTDSYETSVKSNTLNNDLSVYPNPTNGIVNVSLTSPVAGNVTINIYNITGQLMKIINSDDLSAGNNTIHFDISGLAEAQYIYEIITKNEILRGKICKTK